MDLHSVTPTGEPSSNSRGQSFGEPALTNAEVLIVSITIFVTFLFTVQSYARWYTKDRDYTLIDIGTAALAALAQLSSRLKQNNRSGPPAVVPAAMDDLEAGGQVRFVEVQGSHWHSHSNALVDDNAPLSTHPANHDPPVLSRSSDISVMGEQALSASLDAVPEAVSKRGAWEWTLAPPCQEEIQGALPSQGKVQLSGDSVEWVQESQAPVTVTPGVAYSQESFGSISEEFDNCLFGGAGDMRQSMHVELASMRKVDGDISPSLEDIRKHATAAATASTTAGAGVREGGGRSWQDRTDEEVLNGGILIPWDSDDSDD